MKRFLQSLAGGLTLLFVGASCGGDQEDIAYLRGLNALQEERFDLARRYFGEHLESHPEDVEVLRRIGRAWMSGALQSPERARPYWERLLALQPEDHEALLELAQARLTVGEFEEALDHLDRLPVTEDVAGLRAEILMRTDPEAAMTWVHQQLPHGETAKLVLIAAQAAEVLARPEATLEHSRRAVELEPLSVPARYLLSRSLERAGDQRGARREADLHRLLLALSSGTGPGAPLERLRLVDELREKIEPVPDELELLRLDLLIDARQVEEGGQALDEVLMDPQRWSASPAQIATWSERLGRLPIARQWLERALDQAATPETRAQLRHRLARVMRATDPDEAESFLQAALADAPHVAVHHCMLGELATARLDEAQALVSFERALELAPWRADCRVALLRAWQAKADRGAVQRILDAAPEPDPQLTSFRERFGYSQ